jgi:DNA modification methylase
VQDSKWQGAITTGQRPGVNASRCVTCGATRQDAQLGLEPTPEEYIANLVGVFRELRRVLKPTGTAWLNLGDSYASNGVYIGDYKKRHPDHVDLHTANSDRYPQARKGPRGGEYRIKAKDLIGIPWRVAIALQTDGWWLRSDIIWSKPNPMPESVTDRPTKAHEYLFLLTKAERYFFDQEAVREADAGYASGNGFNGRQGGARQTAVDGGHGSAERFTPGAGRNIRSVWTIATRPYPGAHFAVFPPELPERCIKAGSSERGVCPACGAPWVRMVERTNTAGWQPSCAHDAPPQPAVILDPFAGSGTVGLVANRLSRRAILIDLNPEYLRQQMARNAQVPVGL